MVILNNKNVWMSVLTLVLNLVCNENDNTDICFCFIACPGGYFGDNCLFACSCKNNATCDRVTGHCNCTEPGWSGSFCDKSKLF